MALNSLLLTMLCYVLHPQTDELNIFSELLLSGVLYNNNTDLALILSNM